MKPADLLSLVKKSPLVQEIVGHFGKQYPNPPDPLIVCTPSPQPPSPKREGGVSPSLVGEGFREGSKKFRFHLKGIVGSARSLVTAAVFEQTSQTHLVLLPDRESAAYFFNDLQQILSDRVYYFPSSFKRGFQTGIKDNQGLLSRTEVLNHLNGRSRKFIIVSYPEAVSEKVVNKKFLEKNTLKLSVGEQVNMDFILDLLVEYEFERADFVAEPGQFSLRGGLIDV